MILDDPLLDVCLSWRGLCFNTMNLLVVPFAYICSILNFPISFAISVMSDVYLVK